MRINIAKHLFWVISAFVFVAMFNACSPQTQDAEEEQVLDEKQKTEQERQVYFKEMERLEREIKMSEGENKKVQARSLVENYKGYADKFPLDSLSAEFLFKAGNICIGLEDYTYAITFFDRTAEHFPDYLRRPESIYMAGFVYDYHMSQKGKAKEYYEKVIEEYPNHIFATDAKLAIEALYMTDEELIRKFEKNNK
jgi:tetratricopeptide (TPR) repeat protein